MRELREAIRIHPVSISKSDLLKLAETLTVDGDTEKWRISAKIRKRSVTWSLESMNELEQFQFPDRFDSIELSAFGNSADRKVNHYVSVDLCRNNARFWITSSSEIWFYGKLHLLKEFFRQRRQRLWFLSAYKHWLSILASVTLVTVIYFVENEKIFIFILPFVLFLNLVAGANLLFWRFPWVFFDFSTSDSWKNREALMLVFAGLSALSGILAIILTYSKG